MSEAELLVDVKGSLAHVVLNRPKVLNSLSLSMVRGLEELLDRFEEDEAIRAVLLVGAGDRAFCAGGDIRALYDAGKAGDDLPERFWREEYRLDERISRFPKPMVAVMNGITMGGGVGLAAHCSHRITIERTRFAMPEAGIGFFPDVGASWLLTRKAGYFGNYVAMTGLPCGPADTIMAGMADSFVPEASIPALVEALSAIRATDGAEEVSAIVVAFAQPVETEKTEAERTLIDTAFSQRDVEGVLDVLARDGGEFATQTRSYLLAKSPTSLKVTHALYQMGREANGLRECLEREFAVTAGMIRGHDFYEGVRAAIIDKDRNPKWDPAALEDVTADAVAAYFEPVERPLFE